MVMNKNLKLLGVVAGVMLTLTSFGQSNKEVIKVNEGDTINYLLSKGFQYFFPTFEQGRVCFKNNESTAALLNFNLFNNEVHFISSEKQNTKEFRAGEEVRLAEKLVMNDVLFVLIGDQIFINTPRGIMRVVANFDIKLLELDKVTEIGEVKVGGYGQPLATGAATSVTSIDHSDAISSSSENNRISNTAHSEFIAKKSFYLQKNNQIYSANNAKQVGKVFPSIKEDIKSFVKENKTDFSNLADMKMLIEFCIEKLKSSK